MANSGFGHWFHDLTYCEVEFLFIFLEFITNLRACYTRKISWFKFILIQIGFKCANDLL